MNYKYSVVITAYNAQEYIEKALDSIRCQTYTNYEVCLTNNGSIDKTKDLIENYKKRYPLFNLKISHLNKNRGIAGGRNEAIKRATGDFVAFLDADDIWYEKKLERVNEYLNNNQEIDVLDHKVKYIGNMKKQLVDNRNNAICEPVFESLLFNQNQIVNSAAVIKKSLFEKYGLISENKEFHTTEDYELWIRMAKNGAKFGFINEILGEYLIVEGNASSKIELHFQNTFNVLEYYEDTLIKEKKYNLSLLRKLKNKRMANIYYNLWFVWFSKNEYKKSLNAIVNSLKLNPINWKCYIRLLQTIIKNNIL